MIGDTIEMERAKRWSFAASDDRAATGPVTGAETHKAAALELERINADSLLAMCAALLKEQFASMRARGHDRHPHEATEWRGRPPKDLPVAARGGRSAPRR